MIRFCLLTLFLWSGPGWLFAQRAPEEIFSHFPPEKMRSNQVAAVEQWRIAWDSTLNFQQNSNRIIVGTLEYMAEFDTLGQMLREGTYVTEEGTTYLYHFFDYLHDERGFHKETRYYYAPNLVDTNLVHLRKFNFDSFGRHSSELLYQANRVTGILMPLPTDSIAYSYHSFKDERLKSRTYFHEIPGNVTGKRLLETYSYHYFYDSTGALILQTWEDLDSIYKKTRWKYDDYGRLWRKEEYLAAPLEPQTVQQFEYSPGKTLIHEQIFTPPFSGSVRRTLEWYYDEKGLITCIVERNGDEAEPLCKVFRYRTNGRKE